MVLTHEAQARVDARGEPEGAEYAVAPDAAGVGAACAQAAERARDALDVLDVAAVRGKLEQFFADNESKCAAVRVCLMKQDLLLDQFLDAI